MRGSGGCSRWLWKDPFIDGFTCDNVNISRGVLYRGDVRSSVKIGALQPRCYLRQCFNILHGSGTYIFTMIRKLPFHQGATYENVNILPVAQLLSSRG